MNLPDSNSTLLCSAFLYHYIVYNTTMGQSASKSTSKSRTSQSATQPKVTQSPSTRSALETGNGNLNTQPRQSDHPSPQPDHLHSNPHETPSDGQGEWRLKEIPWPDPRVGGDRRMVRILMQDANGPCSLIALGRLWSRAVLNISQYLDPTWLDTLATGQKHLILDSCFIHCRFPTLPPT
jgi:hypothetical protein